MGSLYIGGNFKNNNFMNEQKFRKWLLETENKAETTVKNYVKSIHLISEDYSKNTKENIDIYELNDLSKLLSIREKYGFGGEFFEFGNKSNGTNRAGINAYYRYLSSLKKDSEINSLKKEFIEVLKGFKYQRKRHKIIKDLQSDLLAFFLKK